MKILVKTVVIIIIALIALLSLHHDFTLMMIARRLQAETPLQTTLNYFHYTRNQILFAKYGIGPIYDHSLGPLERGFGYCDQQSNFFVLLCEYGGIPARMLMLECDHGISCHTLAESKIGKTWGIFDLTYGIYFHHPGDSTRLIPKNELEQVVLDSIFNGLYQTRFYTDGHTESISRIRQIRIAVTRWLFPGWLLIHHPLQDAYLSLRSLKLDTPARHYLKARHYSISCRYTDAFHHYQTLIGQSQSDHYPDRTLYQTAYLHHLRHSDSTADSLCRQLIKHYPHSSFKSDTYWLIYQICPTSSHRDSLLKWADNWDSHWERYHHFRYKDSNPKEQP
ncbi:MAG: transglutaminase domain-containing protein [Candidatus Delongbacteria bacterium]|nr:transglutaminase domain-containing protein [Candidatus Delongbacteria bacterium]